MSKVFIYGSCATRDAVPWFPVHNFELGGYVARQSLISAFRPAPVEEFDVSGVSSNFQRRMILGDARGSLRFELQKNEPDMIFWDLCDERLGVNRVQNGGFVTHLRDHVREGIHPGPLGDVIPFGNSEHFDLWNHGLNELVTVLARQGLADRIILNATPWAIRDDAGNDMGNRPRRFNADSTRYIEAARGAGVRIADVPPELAIARTDHKWGRAPYHYVNDTYLAQLEAIVAAARR